MKICPYILARLICKDENPSELMETVFDFMQGYEEFGDKKEKIVVSFACVGEFCGKYNACNPQGVHHDDTATTHSERGSSHPRHD